MEKIMPPDSDEERDKFFDNDTDSLNRFGTQLVETEVKAWDMFRELPPEADHNNLKSETQMLRFLRFIKLLATLLVFIIVLGCGVIAKGSVLFMTSQIRLGQSVEHCNRELDFNRQKTFEATLPEEERIAWVWVLFFALLIPEIGSLIRAIRICFFKSWRKPPILDIVVVMGAETCHAIGIAILAFAVLPNLDVVKGAMLTNCVCFVPGLFGLISEEGRENGEKGKAKRRIFLRMIVDTLALSAQATGFVVWPLVDNHNSPSLIWLIPISLLLTSCGWWENYVSPNSSLGIMKTLGEIKERLKRSRYYIYIFASIWKMICLFTSMIVIWHLRNESVWNLFKLFNISFSEHTIPVYEVRPLLTTSEPGSSGPLPTEDFIEVEAWFNAPLWVLLIQVSAAYLCYITGKYACRIMIQGFSYSLPIVLTVPVTISLLVIFCGLKNGDPCAFDGEIPGYLFFNEPPIYFLSEYLSVQHAWVWLLWLASQAWITRHIWWPKCERLASTEKIFVSPMYSSLLVDQSLALNRRIDDQADTRTKEQVENHDKTDNYIDNVSMRTDSSSPQAAGYGPSASDGITRIFACATMWHETKDEMMEILKSIFRMDEDQSARRVAQKYLQVADPDYYEFETHVFFDDAFVPCGPAPDDGALVNSFVKILMATIDDAASHVHETHVRLRAPKKFPTPYGGKLIWTLPGKTKMIVHLKDKAKIRHKKRWSQVMYMYYLLGHRLMELNIAPERKEVIAENTYLLALDGDIDFQPNAVQLLVDLMKKNRQLGAACGRIHPVGSGAMVWYQKFEYAIGHWLQKATEHMIGCVLCSPGCFSLFRGKALMDDNVMRKYTTRSEEARHYVQYDQGEDRWLCTLLLQRGYRVEYSAASDAYTHCPEGFGEFYNQRRRWVPSTMANIMDLLGDYKKTVSVNDNISALYMGYQSLLLGGSVLGPGTILLMLVGAFVAAFKMDQWTSFTYNIVPIVFFMIICYFTKSDTQLNIAMIISSVYGMVMIAVLVGIMMQISEDGPLAPSSLFFFIVAAQMILTALLHPREVGCLPFAVIYYITVPSMYMLLIIYSLFNLNNVSWGTREVAQTLHKTQEDIEREQREAEEAKKKKKQGSFMGFFTGLRSKIPSTHEDEGSLEFSLGGLFKVMCCTYPKVIDEKQQLMRIADTLESLNRRMEGIERQIDPHVAPLSNRRRNSLSLLRTSSNDLQNRDKLGVLTEDPAENDEALTSDADNSSTRSDPKQERDDLINPYWMEDPDLKKGEVDFISSEEEQFWKDLVDKYLYPIDENKKEKERIVKDLKALRDKTVFGFFMLNAMFVLSLFLIQLNKDLLHLNWPLGVKNDISFNEATEEILIEKEFLQLEPIGMVFLLSFALILLIQFVAMMFHRFGTLSHILAGTEFGWYCTKQIEDISTDALIDRHAVEIARELQRLRGLHEEEELTKDEDGKIRRPTIFDIQKNGQRKQHVGSLANAFEIRFNSISAHMDGPTAPVLRSLSMRRDTHKALEVRRNSLFAEQRRSSRLGSIRSVGSIAESDMTERTEPRIPVVPRRTDSIVSWRDVE